MSDITVKQHFVIFSSPGTFFDETSERPVERWDVDAAVAMMGEIKERYGARPFGFHFVTRGRGPNDLDSKVISRSGFYYVGGKVLTLEEIAAKNDPDDRILLSNMRGNDWDRVWQSTEGWRATKPLLPEDTVLPKTAGGKALHD